MYTITSTLDTSSKLHPYTAETIEYKHNETMKCFTQRLISHNFKSQERSVTLITLFEGGIYLGASEQSVLGVLKAEEKIKWCK